ncbi:MAG: acylphosphatase [Pseudomonadota bacterium]|nr:acylphosphatase [Pseudomonadota bacterium]
MPDDPAVHSVRVLVTGRVQGVWFRGWTAETARSLGLSGWVRNRRDGNVEAIFSGETAAVAEMLRRCGRGPASARVSNVEVVEVSAPVSGEFEVRPTA